MQPDAEEVAEAYHIPLAALDGPVAPTLPRTPDSVKPIVQMPLGGDRVIHALTGAILYQCAAAVLYQRYVDAERSVSRRGRSGRRSTEPCRPRGRCL
jgi:hypothetical protein